MVAELRFHAIKDLKDYGPQKGSDMVMHCGWREARTGDYRRLVEFRTVGYFLNDSRRDLMCKKCVGYVGTALAMGHVAFEDRLNLLPIYEPTNA